MTNRLLVRSQTQRATVGQQRPPRILAFGIIGLAGVPLLGLLAVPVLIGTNTFFAATAGCSGQQAGTAGQPAGGAPAKPIPPHYPYWHKPGGAPDRLA